MFVGAQPGHHCAIPEGVSINDSIPYTKDEADDKYKLDKCKVFQNFSKVKNVTEECPDGWVYDTEVTGKTIVSEVLYSIMILGFTHPKSPNCGNSKLRYYIIDLQALLFMFNSEKGSV